MNGKQSKKLRRLAEVFNGMQNPSQPMQTVDQIYNRLKTVHKNKSNNGKK